MRQFDSIDDLRTQIACWRGEGKRIALVPTMGNLHSGHLKLVTKAQAIADRVVITIFVNPLQFGAGEDFNSYPRTLEQDTDKLRTAGVDLLFAPSVEAIYPSGEGEQTRVEVPGLSDILCGASRPGHFIGVATVVAKLFNLVQPDVAVFGEKDFQQLMVIRRMTRELCLPIEIVGVATDREVDGLARSSRNGYLSPSERAMAPTLFQVMQAASERIANTEDELQAIEASAMETLKQSGFQPDYFTIRRASDLALPSEEDRQLVILAAAQLGRARLIDNLTVVR